MLKKIFISFGALVVLFCIVVAVQPSEYSISRSAVINAPAAKVFEQVNELDEWQDWSPWAELDPNMKVSLEGPESGVGAITRWDGNNDVGTGSMTITESKPSELVKFKLDFLKPMEGTSTAEFNFKEENGQTTVTWSMYGDNNFIAKAMHMVMNCEEMVGEQFDKGLAKLKAVVEADKE